MPAIVCQTSGPLCGLCLDSDHISHCASALGSMTGGALPQGAGGWEKCFGENSDIPGLKAELQSQELAIAQWPQLPSEGS